MKFRPIALVLLQAALLSGGASAEDCVDYGMGPQVVATLPDMAGSVFALIGDRGIVAANGSLQVVDASSAEDLHVIGEVDLPTTGAVWGVEVLNGNAYVIDQGGRLSILDVSDETAPSLLGTLELGAALYGLDRRGTHLYVAHSEFDASGGGVLVVDVSVPTEPEVVFDLEVAGLVNLTVAGTHIYAVVVGWATSIGELVVVDITVPNTPVWVSSVDMQRKGWDPVVQGDVLYVGTAWGLETFSLADPGDPVPLGGVETPGASSLANEILVVGDRLVQSRDGSLRFFDTSDPSAPVFLGSVASIVGSALVELDGQVVAVSTAGTTVVAGLDLEVSGGFVSEVALARRSPGTVMFDRLLFVTPTNLVDIYDVTDPAEPVLRSAVPVSSFWVAYRHPRAYVAGPDGLTVLGLDDPSSPIVGATHPTGADYRHVELFGDYAYVLSTFGIAWSLEAFDISDPDWPVWVGATPIESNSSDIAFNPPYAYVASGVRRHFRVIDISDPAAMATVTVVNPGGEGNVRSMCRMGEFLYVAGSEAGTHVMDVSVPSSPVLLTTLGAEVSARSCAISDGLLYVTDRTAGIQVFDLSSPASPERIARVTTMRSSEMLLNADHEFLFVADPEHRVHVVRPQCGEASVSAPPSASASAEAPFRLERPCPNPFSECTDIAFTLARGLNVDVGVYDIGGRRVRMLCAGPLPPGRNVVRWDGRDSGGQAASAGVYFVRLMGDGVGQTEKVTVVRGR